MSARLRFLILLATGCGSTSTPDRIDLTLLGPYLTVGVERSFVDGNAVEHRPFALTIEGIRASGGRLALRATTQAPGETALDGTFAAVDGRFAVGPATGPLTEATDGTVRVEGRALDGVPLDGVADEVLGATEWVSGQRRVEGRFIGVRSDNEGPEPPSCVDAGEDPPGTVAVVAPEGCLAPRATLEVLRHQLDRAEPAFSALEVRSDGGIQDTIAGRVGDILVVWVRQAGRAGRPVTVVVR